MSDVTGHLDGFQGEFIIGWAHSRVNRVCQITVVNSEGAVVAVGPANLERPDLLSLGQGRANFAFSLIAPELTRSDRYHVFADDVELPNSPLQLGPGLFDGSATIEHGYLTGWVKERSAEFSTPTITVRDHDGVLLLKCSSQLKIFQSDKPFQAANFRAALPDRCFDGKSMRLIIYADDTKLATQDICYRNIGTLEHLSSDACIGWLASPECNSRNLTFNIFRDGQFLAAVKCDKPREDVKAAANTALRVGFDFKFPPTKERAANSTYYSFRFPDSDVELFNGPYVVADKVALVSAARNVQAIALHPEKDVMTPLGRAVLDKALKDFLVLARRSDSLIFAKQYPPVPTPSAVRLNIVIPVYRDVAITAECINSVCATCDPELDRIIIVNDKSPDADMSNMLRAQSAKPNIFLIENPTNIGFVRSVNRALSYCTTGDVLLLNSDTYVFPGVLDEMAKLVRDNPDVGTLTALSNNATIFSYPHSHLRRPLLDDMSWSDVARIALIENCGQIVDVPTGHGFCLLLARALLDRLGGLDESFGRGYGEENDFCARAADLGFRNVAAIGAFVLHHESISFKNERDALLSVNISKLESRFPEYTPTIMAFQQTDGLRRARWALDKARLDHAKRAGKHFALIVSHDLQGGVDRAMSDIEDFVGYGSAEKIILTCRRNFYLDISCNNPLIKATFAPNEVDKLLEMLSAIDIDLVLIHQLIGFSYEFIEMFGEFVKTRHSVFYAHDFYPICPRVTLIDSLGRFCGLPSTTICDRCLSMGGPHEAAVIDPRGAEYHRSVFARFLSRVSHVIAPSQDTASRLGRAIEGVEVLAIPHPEIYGEYPSQYRDGTLVDIAVIGAIGPHKGAAKLLELARLAELQAPELHFEIIGFTDRDDEFARLKNVSITGKYERSQIIPLLKAAKGRIALFLSMWPETYSYTLSEAVEAGFIPLVPDIGAPAERVRQAQYGIVYPFPIDVDELMRILVSLGNGDILLAADQGGPIAFKPDHTRIQMTDVILRGKHASLGVA